MVGMGFLKHRLSRQQPACEKRAQFFGHPRSRLEQREDGLFRNFVDDDFGQRGDLTAYWGACLSIPHIFDGTMS
jgi:hypothetical protein